MDNQQSGLLPSDTTTNEFTSSEFAQAVRRAQAADTVGEYSQAHSGDTNPFPSGEIGRRLRLGVGTATPDDNTSEGRDDQHTQRANIRIILYPTSSKPMAVRVAPRGSTHAVSRQPIILDAAAGPDGPAVSRLTVAQSGHDMAFHILADPVPGRSINPRKLILGEALNVDLYCDPSGDRMIIINLNTDIIKLKRSAAGQGEDSAVARPAIELKINTPIFLDPGSWVISTTEEERHMLQVSILPRGYVSSMAVEAHTWNRQSSKRAFEASQPIAPVKKGKLKDASPEPGATVVFQAVPVSQDESAVATREVAEKSAVPGIHHPLERLEPGATAKIISRHGGYSLTHCETIMLMKNSLVFKAMHSNIPGVAVVKVLRTPSYPVESGMPDESATKIVRTSEMWLKEFRNHSKLSQHEAVVRLYDADARFLSLYMEHVEAPNLASYRLHGGNCTLGVEEAEQILADMTNAIAYVHGQGIAHNDIKPANILFKRSRGAVLIDFGLSSELRDSTVHVGGSPWYIPPEYAFDRKRGAPGDVFALGVVMLFVLRKIPLPDLQPQLNWLIADVLKEEGGNTARSAMFQWLKIVEQAARNPGGLHHPKLETLVGEMLVSDFKRVTVDELLRRQGLD
ncbi:hypothetical protein ACRALDRAFT_1076843 [Sodiomyces alcalophilus JCM 7366]|uniref:uncharacterized protein n=1 Tax=Sodiomyces alcalophilus JCM 7366 TaxID=591952 RepID=UPI0039B59F89